MQHRICRKSYIIKAYFNVIKLKNFSGNKKSERKKKNRVFIFFFVKKKNEINLASKNKGHRKNR